MKSLKGNIAILLAVVLLSCTQGPDKNKIGTVDATLTDIEKSEDQNYAAKADSTTVAGTSEPVLQSGNPVPNIDWDKKIIKTGHVTLELMDYKSFNNNIHNSTKRYGAYIASEQQNETDNKIENVISIKVPVDQFENLMNSLQPEGVKVLEKRITTEDVTGEMVDTKARIEARKQVRDRYLDLLKQAKTMKEILEVQKEVNAIQEDIEAGSGRVQFLGHQSAYSTINLTYFQYLKGNAIDDAAPTFLTKLKEAFKDGGSIITGLVLILVTFWPIIAAAFLLWWIFRRQSLKKLNLVKKVE